MANYISEQELKSRAQYVRITETYGLPLKHSTFAPVVRKANGSADGNALIVLIYILDLCRPNRETRKAGHFRMADLP